MGYTLFFFIRNQFIRTQGSERQNVKKLEGWNPGYLRNCLNLLIKKNVYLNIIRTIEKRDNEDVIYQLNQLINAGFSISDFISGFNEYLRNCMLQKIGDSSEMNM